MKKLIFTNINKDVATLRLYGEVGYDVNGIEIANEINFINEYYPEIKSIEVKINSMGGSVEHGLSICSAMLESAIPVTTIINGMAYSIAGVIAMCGSKRKMKDYGTFMMHDASGGNGDEDILNLITNSLAKIFEGTTSLTLDKCREMMAKETWMSPEECMQMGLVDEIIPTEIKRPMVSNKAELVNFYNSLQKPKTKTMEKLINHFKMDASATDEQVLEKVVAVEVEADTVKAENDALKNENEALKDRLKGFEEAEQAKEQAERVAIVENAFVEGKIEAEKKEEILAMPLKSVELKNLFASLKTTPVHVAVFNNKAQKLERADWTYSDWEKKDPEGLLELKNSNEEEFKRLIKTIK
jgi:ATP-dependent protease ClpP protease subunit/regulator of replication initiation timing